jgi:hypothetical protein
VRGHLGPSGRSYAVGVHRAACLLTGLALWLGVCGASGAAVTSSGIQGRVVEGPTCPVERYPPDPRCAPRPLAATLRIHRAGDTSRVRVVRSGQNGYFKLRLAAGTYVVRPQRIHGSEFPRPPAPFKVRVSHGRFTHLQIEYDTGIR